MLCGNGPGAIVLFYTVATDGRTPERSWSGQARDLFPVSNKKELDDIYNVIPLIS